MRRTALVRAARAKLRAFWPELLCAALLVLIGLAGQKDDPLFAVFVAIILAVGWGLGFRHRMPSLHEKIDRLADGFGGLAREIRDGRAGETRPERTRLHLVRGGRGGAA